MADQHVPQFPSPGPSSAADEYSANPHFIQLQEELRCVLLAGVSSHDPGNATTPEPTSTDEQPPPDQVSVPPSEFDFSRVPGIPKIKLIGHLKNWITECAPYLDNFDRERHFGIHVPVLARQSPPLFYAVLAFSARQMERKALLEENSDDILELYQESISLLAPSLQVKDSNILVTACILALSGLMSGSPRNWRQHIEGCAALFESFEVDGFSGGLLQAVFWCYARMELCGAIISGGAETTVLPLNKWIPPLPAGVSTNDEIDQHARTAFYQSGRDNTGMHANWSVYLCAKACDLAYRRTRVLELQEPDESDTRPFVEQWTRLWGDLQFWLDSRPWSMLPTATSPPPEPFQEHVFPVILFSDYPAISSNQLYHTACIIMLETRPPEAQVPSPQSSPIWHAGRVCGISWTNPHKASLVNAIQPLYLAGRLLTHSSQQFQVARLLQIIHRTTGWGALWRLRDLETEWGYKSEEILGRVTTNA
ncbi:C6 transcription factor [Metarhizium album ARSEF 1941]|uniref:C6 transcription factor n=1 Tax=Metarhizium album (strain ARSEF 1941) TaxID=1081103 RepID=A0A0B2WWZ5_METAS|nr:C6 transcription factor [Metarhizium album ARSEF 1941]KHN97952.1 C6 transcription factor [Metarhizium album ARSEF 1941]